MTDYSILDEDQQAVWLNERKKFLEEQTQRADVAEDAFKTTREERFALEHSCQPNETPEIKALKERKDDLERQLTTARERRDLAATQICKLTAARQAAERRVQDSLGL